MRNPKRLSLLILVFGIGAIGWLVWFSLSPAPANTITGSMACRDCHQRFYDLWSTSFHGLAMQAARPDFVRKALPTDSPEIAIGGFEYHTAVSNGKAWIVERKDGREKRYPIEYALGGKNVYYFLTSLDRGRLQVLPLAFNTRTRAWINTTNSMVRHFPSGNVVDAPLHWTDRLLTFNTSCWGCHVSQVSPNYDPASDSYRTTWTEPGINCETCHGPGAEHIDACRQAGPGKRPDDLKLVVLSQCTIEQKNDTCGSCHAKAALLTARFSPKDRFFDDFDLVTLENADFYPDGRDLGENYTMTSWRMSPCAASGQLDCIKCHTSSGRYRFRERANTNQACLPCHEDKVKDPAPHTHHPADGDGSTCIRCHMPMTEFALMRRSDHSMRPPYPAATIAFESPNACNLCHTDKTAQWADRQVRLWNKRDYQAPVLRLGGLIKAARAEDWTKLPQILDYLRSKSRQEVFATSLIRLLATCPDERKWPVLLAMLDDASPLVRSAAAAALRGRLTVPEVRDALFRATADPYRLVRIRAATALASYPPELIPETSRRQVEQAWSEAEAAFQTRADDWSLSNTLGNFWLDRSQVEKARLSFQRATRLRPDNPMPWVNLSIAWARLGDNVAAEKALTRALEIEPTSPVAKFNLGLLKAEMGDSNVAENLLREALKTDPKMVEAAYNLGILLAAKQDITGALQWCRQAAKLRPEEPRYGYTLAFYLRQAGNVREADDVLQTVIRRHPEFPDAYLLLGEIYTAQGQRQKAREIYTAAARLSHLEPEQKQFLADRLRE